ncbi:O-antigen ligase family protein [Patescibacteria group bacterium]|nr:O-antigen ligase family protein [Patescibacteria group bacterium]
MDILSWILTLAITNGQLIKLSISPTSGITILDMVVSTLCIWGLFSTKLKLVKPPLFITSALIFIAICILSLILTPLHLNSLETLISFLYIVRFSIYILFGWLIYSKALPLVKQNSNKILLLSGVSLAVLGLGQFIIFPDLRFMAEFGWDPHFLRAVSTFLDPNFSGAFFVLTLLLLLKNPGKGKKRNIYFILVYLALLTTFSRSSYGMFLISGLTFSALKRSKKMLIATIVLFSVLLSGFWVYTQLVAVPRNIDRTQSASFRFNTWQQGLELFQKSPILGIGFNTYRFGIAQYDLGDKQFLDSRGSSTNDSSLLFVLATTGILGLTSYLFFLWTLIKSSKGKNLILISGLSGLLIHSFFVNNLFYPFIIIWIMIISTCYVSQSVK